MGPSALIVGSTGAVGRQLLNSLLSESTFSRTYEIGRRKTEYPVHGIKTPPVEGLNKLSSAVVPNETFEDVTALKAKLPEARDWNCVYITLGTTRANAGSPEAFEKIDREYVINAAKAAKLQIDQNLVYCSSGGADPNSSFLYMRSKGQTEAQLASLGYKNTIIFRPGYLRAIGGRDRPHAALETFYGYFSKHVLSHLWANAEISTDVLGRAMMLAGELGTEGCLKHGVGKREHIGTNGEEALVISNSDAIKLSHVSL